MAIIPIGADQASRRRFPFVNYALILINVAVFVYELTLPDQGQCFTAEYSLIPSAILNGKAVGPAFFAAHDGIHGCTVGEPGLVYVTLITAMFLHANLLHIGGNMLYLWVFGDNVEDRLGHFWYLIFYLFCGLVANASQIAATVYSGADPNILNLGASGAIAGVLGAYLVVYPGSRIRTIIFVGFFFTLATLSAFIVIGFWFILELINAFLSIVPVNGAPVASGGVAYFAHVGGFIVGALIALILRPFFKPRGEYAQTYPAWPTHPDLR